MNSITGVIGLYLVPRFGIGIELVMAPAKYVAPKRRCPVADQNLAPFCVLPRVG